MRGLRAPFPLPEDVAMRLFSLSSEPCCKNCRCRNQQHPPTGAEEDGDAAVYNNWAAEPMVRVICARRFTPPSVIGTTPGLSDAVSPTIGPTSDSGHWTMTTILPPAPIRQSPR